MEAERLISICAAITVGALVLYIISRCYPFSCVYYEAGADCLSQPVTWSINLRYKQKSDGRASRTTAH